MNSVTLVPIQIKFLSENAKIPFHGSHGAAGYDLFSAEKVTVNPKSRQLIKTNIAIAIPEGYYGRIAPRSGLALKNGIDVMAGVVDSDYTGDIGVILYNTSDEPFLIEIGNRIAQIILEKCHKISWDKVSEIKSTSRGNKGYGETGK